MQRGIALLTTCLLAVTPAFAQITIDDFSTGQGPILLTAPGDVNMPQGSFTSGAGIISMERDILAELLGGADGLGMTVIVAGGTYNHSQDVTRTGESLVVWDGPDGDAFNIDFTGLGGLDLTDGGTQNALDLLIVAADLGASLTVEVYTDGANSSTITANFPGGALNQTEILKYGDFVANLGGGADFTNVGAISLMIDGSSVAALDVSLDMFETTTTCGDGILDFGEECDEGMNNCDDPGCTCRTDCTLPDCGDNITDPNLGETCDGTDADGCVTACRAPDTTDECTCCGDGVLQGTSGETCDPPGQDAGNGNTCRDDCTFCGDGVMDAGEECDAGMNNSNDPDAPCRPDCTLPVCGDNVVDPGNGETCDPPGPDAGNGNPCRDDCTFCGDGNQDMGEECDDGMNNGDGPGQCRTDCTLPVCGDGIQDPGEECDDGMNNGNGPGQCRPDCTLPVCGDGIQDPGEECDDGMNNGNGPGQCRPDCTLPICGDNIVDPGEQCDGTADAACPGECLSNCTCQPEITQACCLSDGTCENLSSDDCLGAGGLPGLGSCAGDGDGDGIDDACDAPETPVTSPVGMAILMIVLLAAVAFKSRRRLEA